MVPTRTFSLGHRLSDPDLAAAKHKARRAGAGGSGDVSRAQLTRGFESEFGAQPKISAAPGRVNLIGEHTDYNDGFVFPSAIEFLTRVAIAPRDDRKLVLLSEGFEDRFEFGPLPPGVHLHREDAWILTGAAAALMTTLTIIGFTSD